jgi:hypothetical protein
MFRKLLAPDSKRIGRTDVAPRPMLARLQVDYQYDVNTTESNPALTTACFVNQIVAGTSGSDNQTSPAFMQDT